MAIADRSFRIEGKNGRGVLLIHGLTGAPAEMKFLAKSLLRAGYTISAPQLAGHCADRKALLATSWRDWLDSIRRAYDSFAPTVDEVFVAGICVGGELGLLLALEQPDIAAAALYSMTFIYDGWNMPRWTGAVAPILKPFANLPGVRDIDFREPFPFGFKDPRLQELAAKAQNGLIEGALDRVPLGSMYEMYCLALHLEKMAPMVRTPTLLVHAREDDMSDVRNTHRIQRALGGPTELVVLENSYHMVHVDLERERVGAATAAFFDRASQLRAAAFPAGAP